MTSAPWPWMGVLAAIALSSCSIAPARLNPVVAPARDNIGSLLNQALAESGKDFGGPALGRFIEAWKSESGDVSGEIVVGSGERGKVYRITFGGSVKGEPAILHYDTIVPATSFQVRGLEHHRRDGVGIPLIASRGNRANGLDTYLPPEGIVRPLTATLRSTSGRGGTRNVHIDLHCPFAEETVTIQGRTHALAADFSAPWAELLSRTGPLEQRKILDVFTPEPKRETRLYLMEPYDPEKEPLIMIHGLFSSPLTWAATTNHLWGDDTLRRRYQIWHYLYNTSAPALYSSRLLRAQLRELRGMLDPGGDDPAMRRTTLLTHSMGGLVGKGLAVTPGNAFWEAAFTIPPGELRLSPEDRAALTDAFVWRADPRIQRIIFIATPHLGSPVADHWVGRTGRLLAKPPDRFRALYLRVSEANPGAFTPAYRSLGEGRLDGIHALSPDQPSLRILAGLPFTHPVRVHSIIGDRGRSGPLEASSDGVVPYWSSHLADADSETLVPAGHGLIDHPDTLAEIKRILRLAPGG